MTYAAWEPRYRVTQIAPGKLDLFVVTFVDGKSAAVQPITDYDEALAKARAFHRDNPRYQIKVLPLSGPECRNMLGIEQASASQPGDAALKSEMVATLEGVVRDSNDPDARNDAIDLLKNMGAMKP